MARALAELALIREGGWQLSGDRDEWLDFVSPTGTSLPPPSLEPELRDRLFEAFSGDPPELRRVRTGSR